MGGFLRRQSFARILGALVVPTKGGQRDQAGAEDSGQEGLLSVVSGSPSGPIYSVNRGCHEPQVTGLPSVAPMQSAAHALWHVLLAVMVWARWTFQESPGACANPHVTFILTCHAVTICVVSCVCSLLLLAHPPPPALPVLPSPGHTLSPGFVIRLHCPGSLQGTAQTACSARVQLPAPGDPSACQPLV